MASEISRKDPSRKDSSSCWFPYPKRRKRNSRGTSVSLCRFRRHWEVPGRDLFGVFLAFGFTRRTLAFTLALGRLWSNQPSHHDKQSGAEGTLGKAIWFLAMNREQRRAAKSQGKAAPGRPAPVGAAASSVQIAERFAMALSHHQAGRLGEAESLYRQICAVDPHHVDSLHFLGVLAAQVGRTDIAIDLIERALALRPDYAEALYNLG